MNAEHSLYSYPPAHQDATSDDYHGTAVADPYRWLEDDTSPETVAWVTEQNKLSRAFLDAVPARERLLRRLTALWDYPKYSVPAKKGGQYFFSKNDGLQNQAVLYRQSTHRDAPELVLDPNTLSPDGTVALTTTALSRDATLLAYGLSSGGSDWQELHVRDVVGGREHADLIRWCRFTSIAWKHDSTGFFYSRYPEPTSVADTEQTFYNRVYWHRLGSPQEQDRLVYERPDDKELGFSPQVSHDGRYLVLSIWHGTDNESRIAVREVESDAPFTRLLDEADARYEYIDNVGSLFFFNTDLDAPRGRVIAIDLARPEREHWREIIPEGDAPLAFVAAANNRLVAAYSRDVQHEVKLYSLDGAFERDVPLPTAGSITGLFGRLDDPELLLGFESFLFPPATFSYDFASGELATLQTTEVDFDQNAYETRQVFAPSRDGTRVPIFLTHRKGLSLSGDNPVLLYAYGGFNVSLMPFFAPSRIAWLEQGGVYAVANLRGGSEYGEEWHRSGMLERKQNVFDDFIGSAEWLIANGYTRPERLAIMGGSNGGLLVAACMVQRPELFGAVVCQVPVIDMLRYHRFTVGRFWVGEYGNAEESADQFRTLLAYSPLHNIRSGATYPATLITTADTDDRVVPAHARKFAAALQAADAGQNPILLRVEVRAGHGQGKPTAKILEEVADIFAFLVKVLRIED